MTRRPEVCIVAAVARNGVIGRDGGLPWRLRTDLRRFKQLTLGHPLIMGRRTWESIGRPLPGRLSLVLSRSPDFTLDRIEGAAGLPGLDAALERAAEIGATRAFVIGGAEIYRLALPRADVLYLTRVEAEVEGDVHFPQVEWDRWQRVESTTVAAGEHDEYPTTFEVWRRRTVGP